MCQIFLYQGSHHLIFFFYFGYLHSFSYTIDCSSKKVAAAALSTYLFSFFKRVTKESPTTTLSKFLNGIRFSFLNPLNNLTPCRDVVKFFFEPNIAVIPKCVYYPTQEIMSCFYDSLCRPLHNLIIK